MNKNTTRKAASPLAQRPQTPLRLGASHGYAFSGEKVRLNVELELPTHFAGGDYGLELWACTSPCETQADPASSRDNLRVASFSTSLPTPLTPITHRIDAEVAAQLPLAGASYVMVLALVRDPASQQRELVELSNYPQSESFPAPLLGGDVSYEIDGDEVVLHAQNIRNTRDLDNQSGTLSLELWAFAPTQDLAPVNGIAVATFQLAPISDGYFLPQISARAPFKSPGAGQWQTAILLREWTESGFVTRDQRITPSLTFAAIQPATPSSAKVETPAAAAAVSEKSAPAATFATAPVATSETKAAVPSAKATPVKETPAATPAPAPVLTSLATASAEELAKLDGLNARLAKELVKARPLRDWSDLLKIRGIGEATLRKLKLIASL